MPDPHLLCCVQLGVQASILLEYTTRTYYYDPDANQTALNVTTADRADIKSNVQVRPEDSARTRS